MGENMPYIIIILVLLILVIVYAYGLHSANVKIKIKDEQIKDLSKIHEKNQSVDTEKKKLFEKWAKEAEGGSKKLEANIILNSAKVEAQNIIKEAQDTLKKAHEEIDQMISERVDEIVKQEKGVCADLRAKAKKLKEKISASTAELEALESDLIVETVKIDSYDGLRSDEVKNQLAILSTRQDTLVKEGKAVVVTKQISDKKVMNSQIKQLLRCFNSECSGILGAVTVKNADASRAKITRTYEASNKIFAVDGVQISEEYLASKYEELSLIYAYMVKEEEEKEQRRAIREQMVEEEKVRKEIEREKAKIEKEQSQFSNEVNKLMSYMQKAKDDIERKLYIDKINELEEKLKALEADKENVLQREQNTRAGFVYIISNIGSFGEHVYKIGMTRRLEPMDRIAELSSASVPFPFDVHAMIFSDDAPGLESILHQYFDGKRVNRVNPRKEFFRVDLEEIKKVVLDNHNATVKFIEVPDAVEYRETLKLAE